MSKPRLILLDGDIVVFQALASANFEMDLVGEGGCHFIHKMVNFDEAKAYAIRSIERICDAIDAEKVIFTWTDSDGGNFRKEVYPEYKSNRVKTLDTRPLGLKKLKQVLAEKYESHQWDGLEADDVMGILATDPNAYPEYEKIIVSEDKDMQTIPCLLYNPAKDDEPRRITNDMADDFLAIQCLAGDGVDGFSGCPSVGMVTAEQLLTSRTVFRPYEHTFKSGKRKGETEIRYEKQEETANGRWDVIVSCYGKAGLSEEVALSNSRCARILRATDYDNGRVILWSPSLEKF